MRSEGNIRGSDSESSANDSDMEDMSRLASTVYPYGSIMRHRSGCGPYRLERALHGIQSDARSEIFTRGSLYSPETLRKHSWTKKLYETFCRRFHLTPWPLESESVNGFIRFLGEQAGYRYGSIRDVIIPSLKRMNREHIREDNPEQLLIDINLSMRNLRRTRAVNREPQTHDAAIDCDVSWMIRCIPNSYIGKASEASMFILSLCTGARACTVENILLENIKAVFQLERDARVWVIQIEFTHTKGNANWNHVVTLDGILDPLPEELHRTDINLNFIYWLDRHMKTMWGFGIRTFNLHKENKFSLFGDGRRIL